MNDLTRRMKDPVTGELRKLRIGIIDIETTNLNPEYGYITCVCIKDVNANNMKGKIHTFRIDDKRNPDKGSDKWIVEQTIKAIGEYDLLCHWYGSRFDFPFINSRALIHKMPLMGRGTFRRDLCFVSRSNFNFGNNRLRTIGRVCFGRTGKTVITPDFFINAIRGEKKAIDYIVYHCEKDVIETEKIYKRFMPVLGKLKKR